MTAKKKVCFLSFYRHQWRLFHAIQQELTDTVAATHTNLYSLLPWSLLTLPWGRERLSRAATEQLLDYYVRRRILKGKWKQDRRPGFWLRFRMAQWHAFLLKRLRTVDALVIWNGFTLPQRAAIDAAKRLGITVIYGENGVIPGTIVFDPQGINYSSSVARLEPGFFHQLPLDQAKADQLFAMTLEQRPLRKTAGEAEAFCDDDKPLPDRFVVFPMQVHDDSQLVEFGNGYDDMAAVVRFLEEQLQRYREVSGDTLRLVVKEHPSDFGRKSYADLYQSLPGVHFLRQIPVADVIQQAQAVITVNSSVGITALLYQKPLITLGDALFNLVGLCHHYAENTDFVALLRQTLDTVPDRALIARYLLFIQEAWLLPYAKGEQNTENMRLAAARIVDLAENNIPWLPEE